MDHDHTKQAIWPRTIGNPAKSALEHAGIDSYEQLASWTSKNVLKLHGMGPKAFGILVEEMEARGLVFQDPTS